MSHAEDNPTDNSTENRIENPETPANPILPPQSSKSEQQLSEIRQLLFGEDLSSINARSSELESQFQERLQDIATTFSNALNELREEMRAEFADLSKHVEALHQQHCRAEENLSADLSATDDRLQSSIAALEAKLDEERARLDEQKTDRHQLAALLTQVAQQLTEGSA